LVFDLDPGAPATIVDCCEVALWLRDELTDDGLTAYPKTSGSKGLQLYAPVQTRSDDRTNDYAKRVAEKLERRHPRRVVSRMAKKLRRSEEHTSELQSRENLVCRLLLEKKKQQNER